MKGMIRILGFLALLAASSPALAADKLSLNAISNYLNRLSTVQADFTQINDDGTLSTGTLLIKRPGKMRFEYNPPDNALVLATTGSVYIIDPKSNTAPETYPLDRTPLSIILARNVNLAQANMVVGHSSDGTSTIVTAQDPKRPEIGRIEMWFTGDPIALRKWVVYDEAGSTTTVILGATETGLTLSNRLFDLPRRDR